MTVVTMTQTVNELTSGQTYIVRAKEAERLIANSKATKLGTKPVVNPTAKVGKKGN